MTKSNGLPRYVSTDRCRDGSKRLIYRPPGGKRVTLPGPVGSKTFWEAYNAAAAGKPLSAATPRQKTARAAPGTLRAVAEGWYRSAQFRSDDALTQSDKRGVIESILAEPLVVGKPLQFETCPVKSLSPQHVAVLRDRKAGLPNAANKRLRYVRMMLDWAVESGYADTNVAKDTKRVRVPKGGFHVWSVEEVRQFEAFHQVGTRARLAMSLMLLAGLRRSDAVTLGRQHVSDGWIKKPQHKNRNRHPKLIQVPVLPTLASVLAASPLGEMTLLMTAEKKPKPYTIKAFGMRFKAWCVDAGLPHCSAHGLRKAGATIAIDNGASDAQVMAIYGWEDAKEVLTYSRERDRKRLAEEAMHLIEPRQSENEIAAHVKSSQNRVAKTAAK